MSDSQIHVESYGPTDVADIGLCKRVAEELERHYPGHPWLVGANHESGVVEIQLNYPVKVASRLGYFGWMLHLGKLSSNYDWKKVMVAGGEILERYNLARRGAKPGDWEKAKEHGLDVTGAAR